MNYLKWEGPGWYVSIGTQDGTDTFKAGNFSREDKPDEWARISGYGTPGWHNTPESIITNPEQWCRYD